MSEEKKEYTAKEVAEAILKKAQELTKEALEALEKADKSKHDRCVEQVEEQNPDVKNPHAVCVAAGVEPEKWNKSMEKASPENQTSAQMAEVKIPQPQAPKAQPKAIAKQPLQLKKFMEKCWAKKMNKKEGN